ncbi:hypothetical protein C1J05_12570 [Sulfitobacter sp. JL08]|nr:hypothetical protein C1J05_12570 [Sulfitobacter sp. JL08]
MTCRVIHISIAGQTYDFVIKEFSGARAKKTYPQACFCQLFGAVALIRALMATNRAQVAADSGLPDSIASPEPATCNLLL